MKKRSSRLPYVFATALAGFLVVAAWVGRDGRRPVIAGEPAPGFTVRDLQGSPVSLDDYRGKVVLVNIWATWCGPCREEIPSMQRLYDAVGHEDFEILAVSVDVPRGETDRMGRPGVTRDDLRTFAQRYGARFPVFQDTARSIERLYQTTGVPESFIVGRDGVIYRRLAGATVWDAPQYQELIQRLLEG